MVKHILILFKDDDLGRTFKILESPYALESEKQPAQSNIAQRTLNDVTQLHHNHKEAPLLDLSVQFSRTSMKPSNPRSAKCLLDESINFNKSKIAACLPTPLSKKKSKSKNETVARKQSEIASKENRDEEIVGTPHLVKLFDTFIADMMDENVLNATIPDDTDYDSKTADPIGTPDIFKQKRNVIWKNSPETKQNVGTNLVKKNKSVKNSTLLFSRSPATTVGTKLPIRMKTPVHSQGLFSKSPAVSRVSSITTAKDGKPLITKSPAATYIHQSIEIQSMSNTRHRSCLPKFDNRFSKSDKVIRNCKIPVLKEGNVIRKLDL